MRYLLALMLIGLPLGARAQTLDLTSPLVVTAPKPAPPLTAAELTVPPKPTHQQPLMVTHIEWENGSDAIRARQRANLVSAILFLLEGARDCTVTTHHIARLGYKENNPATFGFVMQGFKRDRPGACIMAWTGATALGYAVGNRWDPTIGRVGLFIEGINLLSL